MVIFINKYYCHTFPFSIIDHSHFQLADKDDSLGARNNIKIEEPDPDASFLGDEINHSNVVECSVCPETFFNNHALIAHLLKSHCAYTGLICPYCRDAHHPQRFIDLEAHVTKAHMDKLTGYGVSNECKLCKKSFTGYAELRDHVQIHGDMFREPAPNKELYNANARRRRREKRIDKQKQRQQILTNSRQPIFKAAENIFDNIHNSKFTVIRKVADEELSANSIKRLNSGQLVIEDPDLLSKSLSHIDKNKKGGKQLLVPIKPHQKLNKDDPVCSIKSSTSINMEDGMIPSSTTNLINFDDQISQNDFGLFKVEFEEPIRDIHSIPLKDFEMLTESLMMNENLDKRTQEFPLMPSESPFPQDKLQSIKKENCLPCPPLISSNDNALDEEQGQPGIVVVNEKLQRSPTISNISSKSKIPINSQVKIPSWNVDTPSNRQIYLAKNASIANVIRAIQELKVKRLYKDTKQETTAGVIHNIHINDHIVKNSCIDDGVNSTSHLSTRKKDFVLSSGKNIEDSFDELRDTKRYRKGKFRLPTNDEDGGAYLDNDYETNSISINSQASAAEKFQQISSPFSVAALLAAAELDEEVASEDEPQQD